jgi:hypothetical protein
LLRVVAVVAWCGWVYETADGIFNHLFAAKQKFTGQEDCKLSKYSTNANQARFGIWFWVEPTLVVIPLSSSFFFCRLAIYRSLNTCSNTQFAGAHHVQA